MNQAHRPPIDAARQAFCRALRGTLGAPCAVLPVGAFVRFDEGADGLLPMPRRGDGLHMVRLRPLGPVRRPQGGVRALGVESAVLTTDSAR